jgi:hypothetical protein
LRSTSSTPLAGGERLEQLLALLELQVQVRDDGVREATGLVDRDDGVERLRRDLLVQLDVVLEGPVHGAHQRLALDPRAARLVDRLHLGRERRLLARDAQHPRPALAFDQHLHRAVGQAQQLDDGAEGADIEDVVVGRLVLRRLALGAEHELAILLHRLFQRVDRLGAPHEERDDHARKHDDVA